MKSSQPIRLSGSDLGPEELNAVARVFDGGYLGMGAEVKLFEDDLTEFLGRETACVATGTAALQLALEAIGVGPGDEVAVPSLAYLAAFQAISATGATPIPVDVILDTLTMCPDDLKCALSPNTKAVMPIHYAGGVGKLADVYEIAGKRGLRVVEDAAHAFGSSVDGKRVGSFGDITCFSFDPIKNITSIEGGAVVSDDPMVMDVVRNKRLLGVIGDSEARHQQRRLYEFDVVDQGWRYHMSNVNAAVGRVQLKRFTAKAIQRQMLARQYTKDLHQCDLVQSLHLDYSQVVPHIYVILLSSTQLRDKVKKQLKEKLSVETGLHWFPNHLLTRYHALSRDLPNTVDAFSRMLTLPLHTALSKENIQAISLCVLSSVND